MNTPTDTSRSADCNSSHSLSETASSDKNANQVHDPIVVTVARAGAVASCIPSLQGLQVKSLWDTGATLCLVDRLMSHRLVLRGAIQNDLVRPVVIDGVRNGRLNGQSSITATIRFNDGKTRKLQAVVVDRLYCELIIGLDFMQDEHILFEPRPGGFKLRDGKLAGHPEIYDSKDAPVVDDAAQTEASKAELAYAARCEQIMNDPQQKQKLGHLKEGSPQWDRICRRWEALLPEDRELICRLNEVKLVDLPEDELLSRLAKLNFVETS